MDTKAKPITFMIEQGLEVESLPGQLETVKFEIEGGGGIVTSFVRKNEQEFFEFIHDFNKGC
jgi:hypothetical protein